LVFGTDIVRVPTIKIFDPLNCKLSTIFAFLPEKNAPKGDDRAKNTHTHIIVKAKNGF